VTGRVVENLWLQWRMHQGSALADRRPFYGLFYAAAGALEVEFVVTSRERGVADVVVCCERRSLLTLADCPRREPPAR